MSEQVGSARQRSRRRRENVSGGRQHKHEVKVSADEEARLLVMAQDAGVTIPRLLVERAFAPEGGSTSTERREFLAELYAMRRLLLIDSNNLNQIARSVNAGSGLGSDFLATLHAINAVVQRIDVRLQEQAVRA